jgi:hypothetical protein
MYKVRSILPFSLFTASCWAACICAVVYIGLMATVMTYAALTIEFSQSVKNDEATVATLEGRYLTEVSRIQSLDYRTIGYVVPTEKYFVPAANMTALR